jgi:hypothetical protein
MEMKNKFELIPICTLSYHSTGSQRIGETPEGLLSLGIMSEGIVSGEKLRGTVLAGTQDWSLVRRDGIHRPDCKAIIKTHDDAIIQITYQGFMDLGPDGYEMRRTGGLSGILHPRTMIRMLTESADYDWVNRAPFIGIGLLEFTPSAHVTYEIYQLTTPPPGPQ